MQQVEAKICIEALESFPLSISLTAKSFSTITFGGLLTPKLIRVRRGMDYSGRLILITAAKTRP